MNYSTLKIIPKENYVIVQLQRGAANAINQKMVDELHQLLQDLEANKAIKGLILTGKAPFFTAGVDLLEVYDYDAAATRHFWGTFLKLAVAFIRFSKPVVNAITGHSPAGGCILACSCDYRVMAEGKKFKIGLNEIAVGIAPRESILELYAFWIGKRRAYQFLLEGYMLSGVEALAVGLVDQLVPMDDVLTQAEKKMNQYLKLPPMAFCQTKKAMRSGLVQKMTADFESDLENLHQQLMSEESRTIMGQMVSYLKSKK